MITIYTGIKGNAYYMESKGHADYEPGNDIVCAAVSSLMFTLAGAVTNLSGGGKKVIREGEGQMSIRYWPRDMEDSQNMKVIWNTIIIGLLQIVKKYPKNVKLIRENG